MPSPSIVARFWPYAVLLLILALAGSVRIRLLDVPLERDEGEYAYAGQLILQGYPPYAKAYNMKLPGIYYAYAAIMAVFGETHRGIHAGLLVVNAATIVLVFFLGRRLFGNVTALAASAAFALMSLSQGVLGFTANAEHFVLPPALAGVLLLLHAVDSSRAWQYFASGLLLGTAFIIKQHGMFFPLFAGVYLVALDVKQPPRLWLHAVGKYLWLGGGVALPFVAVCAVLYLAGVFETFWFWVFQYAAAYVNQVPVYVGITWFPGSLWQVAQPCLVLWVLALIGLAASWAWARREFLILFFGCSLLSVFPGFYFREHYFILLLPAVALLAGVGAVSLGSLGAPLRNARSERAVTVLVTLAALAYSFYAERAYLFFWSPTEVARMTYGANPFPESLVIAEYLQKHTSPEDRIAVIGSEPQIYFYARRHSATGHIYTYALMEDHPFVRHMQEEMIQEIETARPEYLVFVNIPSSWLEDAKSDRFIFEWFERYEKGFDRVGVVLLTGAEPRYYWDDEARNYTLSGGYWVSILKRRK